MILNNNQIEESCIHTIKDENKQSPTAKNLNNAEFDQNFSIVKRRKNYLLSSSARFGSANKNIIKSEENIKKSLKSESENSYRNPNSFKEMNCLICFEKVADSVIMECCHGGFYSILGIH